MRWTVAIGGGILAMAVLIGGAVWGYLAKPPPDDLFRLPTDLKPVHYEVRLQPFLSGNFSVLGHVDIELKALTEAYSITLHVADIDINTGTIRVAPPNSTTETGFEILETATDTNLDLFVVHLKQRLLEGESYILSLDFEGHLNDELRGFYRSSYKDEAGDDRMLAATFFAPAHARRAFPCMDEPALKATFSISLAHEDRLHALSNMPLRDSEPVHPFPHEHLLPKCNLDVQHPPPSSNPRPPPSLQRGAGGVGVGPLRDVGAHVHVPRRLRHLGLQEQVGWTWAREAALEQVDYALETGPKALSFFEDYFGIPYPLPKEDMVALPDFAPGAMENWGLITYRETAMLYSPEESSASNKQRVATVVVHELAHQWFGNLVTPTWWTDVWLNEGFASFMEYVGTEHVEPSWQMKEQFVVSELQYVFGIDSLESSHPISVPVVNQDQLGEIYDVIAYVKGASIIRMMNYYLGEETFRKGISNYLKAFEYAAADQDDLWQFLTQAAHEDDALAADVTVKDIMDTWTLQTGYPVVKVERDVTGTTALDAPDFTRTRPSAWLTPGTSTLILDGLPSADAWVLLNLQQTGYFRVNYDAGNWELLTKQLADAHEVIHVTNRAQVMDDALNLARAVNPSSPTTNQLPEPQLTSPFFHKASSPDLAHKPLFLPPPKPPHQPFSLPLSPSQQKLLSPPKASFP
ncbi:putative aminopeptidase N-like [Penaeus vannamei]|uniref:Putative aminopeptidase N-like n=1 Tax=Penaeus vannamei TaxID=6689 RepID=A0A3R7M511_PENVA|nr:putative aminopeptidase N-like [Penaeus vannamei]